MAFKRAIGNPTKAQKAMHDRLVGMGCAVCHFRIEKRLQPSMWGQGGGTHLHHRNQDDKHGQKQLGHNDVVALCEWHHEGIPIYVHGKVLTTERMRDIYGPSFKAHPRDFREWTADVLPDMGRGTEAWQNYQHQLLEIERRT